jgi:glutamyl-tRNA reductase
MNLVLVGVNHRSAGVEVRERLHFPAEALPDALHRLRSRAEIGEAYLLSTCNRTELLVNGREGSEAALSAVREFLAGERSLTPEELDRYLYVHRDRDAIHHLFRLGVGLDSMILGEPQILGQVKEGYHAAQQAGSLGGLLGPLLERSFSVAKKVRTSSEIGRNPVSVSFAAVELAQQIFGDLEGKGVLILGAGETAELTARHLGSNGANPIYVANRTFSRAQDLARCFDGEAIPYDQFGDYLEKVDIMISSTSAPHFVLRHDDVVGTIRRRRNRPLFLIDIAVPRDIDPAVNRIDNVYLYDVDDLRHVADAGLKKRREAARDAEQMVEAEVDQFMTWCRSQQVAPTIVALREKLHGLREAEMERFGGRLRDLEPTHRKAVEELTTALINKVLHPPIKLLKREASSPNGVGAMDLIRQAFGLGASGETKSGSGCTSEAAAKPEPPPPGKEERR